MIHVIATIEVKPGCRDAFLDILRSNVAAVKAEKGCLAYAPTVDAATDIPVQEKSGENVVTIIEGWEDLAALKRHSSAPHMLAYRDRTKALVHKVSIRVLQPA